MLIASTKIKRELQGQVDFNSLLREKRIVISPVDQSDLENVYFSIFIQPSFQPFLAQQALASAQDIRLYINDEDFTDQVKSELKRLIQARPPADIKDQYKKGMAKWINYVPKFGVPDFDAANQKVIADNLANGSVVSQLDLLGDHKVGWNGNLHILNYLYTFVDIDPISVNDLIASKYNQPNPTKTSIKDYVPAKITFSQGPAPSIGDFPRDPQPRGQLSYTLDFIYTNRLYQLMQRIYEQGSDIQRWVDNQRVNYLEPIKNELDTMQKDTALKLDSNQAAVTDLSKTIKTALKL